ncbi:MAG: ATP-binding protein [Megasphaera sp.]|uniref:ATP-binding protein n=1 Tax=Megasphaera sp. TaxID=2023260 RepID=UPI003F0B3DC7
MFIGRKEELARLTEMYQSPQQEVVLIYGRRRVGKSELIKRFLQRCQAEGIYYQCKRTTEMNNVESLSALFSDVYGYPPLAFQGLEALLDFFFRQACQKKQVLVLDEYPYLRQTVKGLDSILQSLIDKYRGQSQLKLILCGSFVDTMKSLLLEENPLYGRLTLTIHLHPMDYLEAAQFYPAFSAADKVRLYSVFGGIPYYNQLIDETKSVRDNIIRLLVETGARLENEVQMYLLGELGKFVNANEAFEALARGFHRYKDILSQSHISSGPALAEVLKRLILMELVVKTAPINDAKNARKTSYRIADNMACFYYRYLFRYSSQRQIMAADAFYDRYIAADFEEQLVPHCFEDICRQFLIRQNRCGNLPEIFDAIGKYYYDLPKEHRNGEFDVVTHDAKGYIFYEAKFRQTPLTEAMLETEIRQVRQTGMDCYRYGFFSRAGYDLKKTRTDVVLYTLDDLYTCKICK